MTTMDIMGVGGMTRRGHCYSPKMSNMAMKDKAIKKSTRQEILRENEEEVVTMPPKK